VSDYNYVRRWPDLDPGPRKPDGTKRSIGERVKAVGDALAAQGRITPNGKLIRKRADPPPPVSDPSKPDPII
jgi:hypothetical protein